MVTIILFRLLMIHIAIQFAVTSILEGRTSHYVTLLNSSGSDSNAKRITCPVYSIRIANETTKFTKYIASEEQFNRTTDADWTEVNSASFKECASAASSDNKKMFMWVDDECRVTDKLFKRRSEPCNEETSTLVYMIEATELYCGDEFLILNDGDTESRVICDGTPSTRIKCLSGKIFGYDGSFAQVYYDNGNGCIIIKGNGGNDPHSAQMVSCLSGEISCYPNNDSERSEYVQILKELATVATTEHNLEFTAVELVKVSGTWQWPTSGVTQPEDEGWDSSSPITSPVSGSGFAYITSDGLKDAGSSGLSSSSCCYKAH